MKKSKKILLILSVFILIFSSGCQKQKNTNTENENTNSNLNESTELTPEQVLAQMDAAEGVGLEQGSITVAIISPEEEKFSQSQARFYNAQIKGLVNGSSCTCDWKFYLNEYDEETLYQQMDDRQCTGSDKNTGLVCGFTSTFINSRGDLRVVVDVEVEKDGQIVQTASDEKKYRVE